MNPPNVFDYWRGGDLDQDHLHRLSDLSCRDCGNVALLLRRFRRQRLYLMLFFAALCGVAMYLTVNLLVHWLPAVMNRADASSAVQLIAAVIFSITVLVYATKKTRWRRISFANWLDYLDHQYPYLNHSSDLLTRPTEQLNPVQRLQKQRTVGLVSDLLNCPNAVILPRRFNHPKPNQFVWLAVLILLLSFGHYWQTHLLSRPTFEPSVKQGAEQGTKQRYGKITVVNLAITVTPPAYTGIAEYKSDSSEIRAVSGSKVTWTLELNQPVDNVSVTFSDGKTMPMTKQVTGRYELIYDVSQTSTYSFVVESNDKAVDHEHDREQQLQQAAEPAITETLISDSAYTIQVFIDRPPEIRIITPQNTITRLDKNASPRVSLQAQVFDDHGLQDAHILASVAKGSGEAVKFRDSKLEFDQIKALQIGQNTRATTTEQQDITAENNRYQLLKVFDLDALSMEPGDELYFTIIAADNREPKAQQSRSRTYIIRWLDEDSQVILADGMVLDLLPEYFKSQRQIIIETRQLIADKRLLSVNEFNQTSKQLGFSQGDLKLKYGQYLGDENEGFSASGDDSAPESDREEKDSHEDHEHHSKESQFDLSGPGVEHSNDRVEGVGEHSHETHDDGGLQPSRDLSGAQQIIDTFGHAHEDVDVGVSTAQDPKALMKMALSFMWQAELELMLHQPSKALPFEEQALSYLTRAQKADRIYVKRLGFEPPPVSEERRYQGDLSDIKQRQEQQDVEDASHPVLRLYLQMQGLEANSWSTQSEQVLVALQAVLNDRLGQHPELIDYVAMTQQLLSHRSFTPPQCLQCWDRLNRQLYRMIPVQSKSLFQQQSFYPRTPLMRDALMPNDGVSSSRETQ
ncbi:hypothetical protein FE810_14900 [Thalassotalea litorea]|uniref:DUF4175 domain-containing protein n=1 Tax=Thalassotalea litorea TaxID=2020715 RepID=A0A5R9IJ36_9GAMM|nr:hypothetical protein [Thalassotalea litorea]TLU61297.1 hypothetical protein FE810_14900 [Thalassotalea litorea]